MADIQLVKVEDVTVRFAGDSGDGMQLTGLQFSTSSAIAGNDLNTLPDYPAEIRAPAGSLHGVSGFQIRFSSGESPTHGDNPDVLVAMNPAALKVNLKDLKRDATILVNESSFDNKNLSLAKYETNPLDDGSLKGYNVLRVPMTKAVMNALEGVNISLKDKERCKNFFALGIMFWMYSRPIEPTIDWIENKFRNKPELMTANKKALMAGYHYSEMTELFTTRFYLEPYKLPAGNYKNVTGNEAVALGMVAASWKSNLPLFLGSYPITPASEILHELSSFKHFGVKTFQAEDEIASIAACIGAAFAGNLALTTTSGPGLALKMEAVGLGVMTELPIVIVDVQRGGPSTGLPTKTEQGDLLQALYGRNGEAPVCVLAAATPVDCFYMAYEASRIAVKYMTPVILLTNGYLAQGSEPFRIPSEDELPDFKVEFRTEEEGFFPYLRDENLARPWAIPGTPGLEHRIGGLEKANITGNVNYSPENHEFMVKLRDQKIKNIAKEAPKLEVRGEQKGDLLVLGWGSTYGAITEAVNRIMARGLKISQVHLRYINPIHPDLGDILKKFKRVLIPEINLGQMATVIRSKYLIDVVQFNRIQGLPIKASEIEEKILNMLGVKK
ncbi:MAG: 2-oxoacid:acceptor oxidoreductase subunit alpha [Ignavibacteriales bacterium]|nr:MAG: 2-oxoacid:acceptor oxidoreductase subunit alpha [Ignavibacteriaceae bacterium]MBW7872003.1 2-oxoacid:acceptor oxidoreductase subunit alpha [Ignavibacteria bacterium]MCZ2144099.1 2-oxoacid:acceptor oxidoreductase subunit alpha [Ignavibacteriales bacterium]MBV6446101.1 2-oxoglutarate oxidoreductase subunit KorA [Ignavibacteriaceae bacterium]MBZ0197383.1 2-oxoacid:acceptor oxidoreductase subunit alpha [Ignavibacteriaceae bacterium]